MTMSDVLGRIRNRVGEKNLFAGNILKRHGCSVKLSDISLEKVVVDLDAVFPSGREGKRQCECVVFYFDSGANFVAVPIEFKSGEVNASVASQQLKQGANYAARFIPGGTKPVCIPILLHNGSIHKAEVRKLKSSRTNVLFRGRKFEINTARCGANLADLLARAGHL